MKIITSGIDSEYVLADLSSHLRRKGWSVEEFDFGRFQGDADKALADYSEGTTAYITSAHTNLTGTVAEVAAPHVRRKYPNYLAPLDFIAKLRPRLSVYVPHDLLLPFGDSNLGEYRYLDNFDVLLAPGREAELQQIVGPQTRVLEAGWIKAANIPSTRKPAAGAAPRVTLFVSDVEWLQWKFGTEGIVSYFAPIVARGMRVKFPAWHGVRAMEEQFRHHLPVEVVDSGANSTMLIADSDVVICNAVSSIHAESNLMGVPVISLIDDQYHGLSMQISKLSHLPKVHFHDYSGRAPLAEDVIRRLAGQREDLGTGLFRYELVEELIAGVV
jgi:hypothetical protein